MLDQPLYLLYIKKLIAGISSLFPGILGALITLKFAPTGQSYFSKFTSFLSGVIITHYFGWTVIEKFHIPVESLMSSSILFIFGLFGFTLVSEFIKQAPTFVSGIIDRILGLIKSK